MLKYLYCFCLLFFTELLPATLSAQQTNTGTLRATTVIGTSNTGWSKRVVNPGNAVTDVQTNYAVIQSPVLSLITTEYIRLGFPGSVPEGYTAGFVISTSTALLNLKVLPIISIRTYNEKSATVQEISIDPELLTTGLFSGSTQPVTIGFTNSKPFTSMELRVTYPAGISLGGDLRVYGAIAGPPVSPPPVSLLSFNGKANPNEIQLSWETASELDNQHFVVERNADGIVFDSIATVSGAGTTSIRQSYSFVDRGLVKQKPGTYYYRLKQVDFDGTVDFSKVIALQWRITLTENRLTLYPNPANVNQGITLKLTYAPTQDQVVYVYNSEGKLVRQAQIVDHLTTVSTYGLAPGMYVFIIPQKAGERPMTQKLLLSN